jgi:hypothetical protein
MPTITESLVASIESELEVLKSLPAEPTPAPEPVPAPAPLVEAEMTPLRKLVLQQAAERAARG